MPAARERGGVDDTLPDRRNDAAADDAERQILKREVAVFGDWDPTAPPLRRRVHSKKPACKRSEIGWLKLQLPYERNAVRRIVSIAAVSKRRRRQLK